MKLFLFPNVIIGLLSLIMGTCNKDVDDHRYHYEVKQYVIDDKKGNFTVITDVWDTDSAVILVNLHDINVIDQDTSQYLVQQRYTASKWIRQLRKLNKTLK